MPPELDQIPALPKLHDPFRRRAVLGGILAGLPCFLAAGAVLAGESEGERDQDRHEDEVYRRVPMPSGRKKLTEKEYTDWRKRFRRESEALLRERLMAADAKLQAAAGN